MLLEFTKSGKNNIYWQEMFELFRCRHTVDRRYNANFKFDESVFAIFSINCDQCLCHIFEISDDNHP